MIGRFLTRAAAVWRGRQGEGAGNSPRVFYGRARVARPADMAFGGAVKFQYLQDALPNTPRGFNLLYLVSSGMPAAAASLVRAAKARGVRFAWNQNGVGFPAWHGPGWERVNEPMRDLLVMADHVFYQSAFCRASADRFVGPCSAPSEILYNAVDTARFAPVDAPTRPLTLLAAGSHWQAYRVQCAVACLAEVRRVAKDARLVVAGRFCWGPSPEAARREVESMCERAGVASAVELAGPYAQQDAPAALRRGDILVHAKCNDPCPSLVLEAMACGLPVVYSASGGTPELVGPAAGRAVASDVTWERHTPPDPAALARAVLDIAGDLASFRASARERAVTQFDVAAWKRRHVDVFHALLSGRPATAPEASS